jgi:hypothetical protein
MSDDRPILDWRPNHDPRSRNFPIRTALPTSKERKTKRYKIGPITNQGAEGACVGHAWTAEATAEPTPVDLKRLKIYAPTAPDDFARFIYGMAQYLDEWPGESYEGTSTNAGAKAMRNAGLVTEWRWAFGGAEEVADTISWKSPVVLGIPWYESMYAAPAGVLQVGGRVVGGHCIFASGVVLNADVLGGRTGIELTNSWGENWGIKGQALIAIDDLGKLLRQDGEACVPLRRSYGR